MKRSDNFGEPLVEQLRKFCLVNGISDQDVLAITIQKNRTTSFVSLIIDFKNARLLPNYPAEMLGDYKEKTFGKFLICYKEKLPEIQWDNLTIPGEDEKYPFCCENLQEYKPRKLDTEKVFTDFLITKGHNPSIVYEVKKQVSNGPLIWTKYFTLKNNHREEVKGNFTHKKHAFKNYICHQHNFFYAIDLYQAYESFNYHHMRLNPFQMKNDELLEEFLAT